MPPDYNGVDSYLSDIRVNFIVDNESAQYRPGRVSEEGEVVLTDPDAMGRILRMFDDRAKKKTEQDGPDLAELEQTYRV